MPNNEQAPGSQHNIVAGTGNITTGGIFIDSQVSSTNISAGVDARSPASWVGELADELAKAHERLDDPGLPVTPDLEDAVAVVEALQAEIVALREELAAGQPLGPENQTMLRRRVKELLGVLLPVAEMIGGIAGFQDILHHL